MNITESRAILVFISLALLVVGCGEHPHEAADRPHDSSESESETEFEFDYPGLDPEPFLPEITSGDDAELAVALSPRSDEFFFTRIGVDETGMRFELLHSRLVDGRWTEPAPAEFSSGRPEAEAFFDGSGDRLYFYSGRPASGAAEPPQTMNLWRVDRESTGWGPPRLVGRPDAPIEFGWSGCLVGDDEFFFTARPYDDPGLADIYRVPFEDGVFGATESLGPPINTAQYTENEPAVAPDGSFLVFYSAGRPDNLSSELLGDLYISFRDNDGSWTEPRHIDEPINSPAEENWPRITPDGKYLIFSSDRGEGVEMPDLFWVSTKALERYRPGADE
jgi:hypothetical protein